MRKLNILITEANAHVRKFLKRELSDDGILVESAENAKQMLARLYSEPHLDVLIIDPDLPDMDVVSVIKEINDRIPGLSIVFHTFPVDYAQYVGMVSNAVFIEKQGSSIERLKQVVGDIKDRKYMPI